jgi:hypothetical protein
MKIIHVKIIKDRTSKFIKIFNLCLGTSLVISESLPFTDNKFNGIFHMLFKIVEKIPKDFK